MKKSFKNMVVKPALVLTALTLLWYGAKETSTYKTYEGVCTDKTWESPDPDFGGGSANITLDDSITLDAGVSFISGFPKKPYDVIKEEKAYRIRTKTGPFFFPEEIKKVEPIPGTLTEQL